MLQFNLGLLFWHSIGVPPYWIQPCSLNRTRSCSAIASAVLLAAPSILLLPVISIPTLAPPITIRPIGLEVAARTASGTITPGVLPPAEIKDGVYPREYIPNTEKPGPNEMRVIALGTGIPNAVIDENVAPPRTTMAYKTAPRLPASEAAKLIFDYVYGGKWKAYTPPPLPKE